jgi:hypothetical protein
MRHHSGLGIGHLYAQSFGACSISRESADIEVSEDPIPEQLSGSGGSRDMKAIDVDNGLDDETDNPEISLEDRENEGWDEVESDDSEDGHYSDDQSSESNAE